MENTIPNNCEFKKRSGTSGLSGQLYQTKLLTLILLRALSDDNTEEFVLGTNIEGIGALDDIVFRYKTKDTIKSKILFLQAKHREDPNKDKLTDEDIFKYNGDFCLHKYLESCLKIKQKLFMDNHNIMFRGPTKDIECEYIIYTPTKENFNKKKILQNCDEQNYIKTKEDGIVFQFQYNDEDVERLVATLTKSRIDTLAKSIAKMIKKDNCNNIMTNDCIKTYHVFLTQNVITVETITTSAVHSDGSHLENNVRNTQCAGKFKESFLRSNDDYLLLMKRVLCKEIAGADVIASEVDTLLKSVRFKLPVDFGNLFFRFYGNKKKQQRKLDYLCLTFDKLLKNVSHQNSSHMFIELDDYCVGNNEIIQNKDLENYRLGGLVGNLLINDEETEMLKFNLNERSLSEDNIKILKRLEYHYDLSKFRFDINVYGFPRLQLNCNKHDRQLVKSFFNSLKFYTNQAKEDEVEVLIKKEIHHLFKFQRKRNVSLLRVKSDAIYLNVHDEVLQWWKQPNSASYLTKSCKLFQQAEKEILDSPLMNIMSSTLKKKIDNLLLKFTCEAINSLTLERFLNSGENIMIITTDDIDSSSKRVAQFFDGLKRQEFYFIDLDGVISENCLEVVLSELQSQNLVAPVLVVIAEGTKDGCKEKNKNVCENINSITKEFRGQIILLNHKRLEVDLKSVFPSYHFLRDIKNNFSCLGSEIRNIILEKRKLIFQGIEVIVNAVLDCTSLDLLSTNLLHKLISGETIEIGRTLTNSTYNEINDCYINRKLCQYITLNINKHKDKFCYISDESNVDMIPQDINDVVVTTDTKSRFEKICKINSRANVHWFMKKEGIAEVVWKETQGSPGAIIKCVERGLHEDLMFEVETLKDIREKVVIISSEPGMGKSTLLTHLAINTKRLHPTLWIFKINLLDYVDYFSKWKVYKTDINLVEVIYFLYYTIGSRDCKFDSIYKEVISKLINVNSLSDINKHEQYLPDSLITVNNINELNEQYLPDSDLSLIKLFIYFYNNNNFAVLFDGFDEICPDYSKEVIQLLCTLKISKVAHLWVTSRTYNILDQLELAFETFTYRLSPLEVSEQKQYLQNVWSNKMKLIPDAMLDATSGKINSYYIDVFYSSIMNVVGHSEVISFTSLPLHLYMIAEAYQVVLNHMHVAEQLLQRLCLIRLYEGFTEKKFYNIRFGEKKQSVSFKDPDLRKMIEKEYKHFVDNHKKIAAYLLLDNSVMLSKDDIKIVNEFIEIVKSGDEKTGIIEYIAGDNPKFVHYTFAEYFAAELIFDKLMSPNDDSAVWKYFMEYILISNKYGIRRFINSKLAIDRNMKCELQSNKQQIYLILNIMLAQSAKWPNHAISVAIEEDLDEIVLFLLGCIKTVINKDNLSDFIEIIIGDIGIAIVKRKVRIVKFCLELVRDVDSSKLKNVLCARSRNSSPFQIALDFQETSVVVVKALQCYPELLVDFFTFRHECHIGSTPAHYLGTKGFLLTYCRNYIKLSKKQYIQIFSVKDLMGQLPLHYAAKENDYSFFGEMERLLGREIFINMCKTVDNHGFTPICMLSYNNLYFEYLKILLKKVYGEPDIDVKYFVINKLPKLYPKKILESQVKNCYICKPFVQNTHIRSSSAVIIVGNAHLHKTPDEVLHSLEAKTELMGQAAVRYTLYEESRSRLPPYFRLNIHTENSYD